MSYFLKKADTQKRNERSPKTPLSKKGEHNYANMDTLKPPETEGDLVALPDTPIKSPAAKKAILTEPEPSLFELQKTILKAVNDRADDLALMINSNASDIKEIKNSLEFAFEEINDVKAENKKLKEIYEEQQTELTAIKERLCDAERYKRRWCLRLYGVSEVDGEDVKRRVTEICEKVAPELRTKVAEGIDVVHRLGRRDNTSRARGIIILFAYRTVRDVIWRQAKNNAYLRDNKLRFSEDLTKEERDARAVLWPIVEKARKDGLKAHFVGAKAYVNGKEIRHNCSL